MKVIEGKLSAKGCTFALVVSRWNSFITSKLLDGAIDIIVRHDGDRDKITVVWAPGAFELPAIVSRVAGGDYDAVIALGCVIRGGTPHFDYIAAEVSKGVAHVALEGKVPVSFGVLTTDTIEQAIERAGSKAGNKGAEAAMAALEMIDLYRQV
ncbi:MAG: 6,7-dimethyl-8-ribityllumazine synthase [Candidatus Lernaella stagnicola]|nr:6,7-dimethyl-8-ribityllumazine synthase [Candidatus Lernaella stagnicola]